MSFEWKIYVRDANLNRIAELDEYSEAIFTPVCNDVGTWEIHCDMRSDQAANLVTPGHGIIVVRDGASQVVLSGPTTNQRRTVSTDGQLLVVSGVTDDVWLKRRVVSPSPAESTPPYTTADYDKASGPASTVLSHYVDVNAGLGAIPQRRVPGLTVAADPGIGSNVDGSGRWDNLLTFLQGLATNGGVGFRVVQIDGSTLQFQVYVSRDRAGTVTFSTALGSMAGYEYEDNAPTGNYFFVGGQGDGTARTIQEVPDDESISIWGRIEGDFVDRRDTNDATQLKQAGTDALTNGQEQSSLKVTPLELPGLRYGIDYQLGDRVTVQIDDQQVQDVLRSVEIHLTPQGPQTVTPTIGTEAAASVGRVPKFLRQFKGALTRLNNLERQ